MLVLPQLSRFCSTDYDSTYGTINWHVISPRCRQYVCIVYVNSILNITCIRKMFRTCRENYFFSFICYFENKIFILFNSIFPSHVYPRAGLAKTKHIAAPRAAAKTATVSAALTPKPSYKNPPIELEKMEPSEVVAKLSDCPLAESLGAI